MSEMKLEDFTNLVLDKHSYVLNIGKFNINIRFFKMYAKIEPEDQEYLLKRVEEWTKNEEQYGSETFYKHNGKLVGIVTYGLIS